MNRLRPVRSSESLGSKSTARDRPLGGTGAVPNLSLPPETGVRPDPGGQENPDRVKASAKAPSGFSAFRTAPTAVRRQTPLPSRRLPWRPAARPAPGETGTRPDRHPARHPARWAPGRAFAPWGRELTADTWDGSLPALGAHRRAARRGLDAPADAGRETTGRVRENEVAIWLAPTPTVTVACLCRRKGKPERGSGECLRALTHRDRLRAGPWDHLRVEPSSASDATLRGGPSLRGGCRSLRVRAGRDGQSTGLRPGRHSVGLRADRAG